MGDREMGRHEISVCIRDVRRSFGDIVAVNGLSLEVRQGEIFGLLGPNGAGKTTTISMVCGLLRADSGEIRINGDSLQTNPRGAASRIGHCPQELTIWEMLTCLEQLEFLGQQYGLTWKAARSRAHELLATFGLQEKARRLAKTLSGGMKRRLNIALGLVHDPEVLILDEPQAGLDPQSRIMVREQIRSLAGSKTVILTTHDMDEVDRVADRIAIIDRGELLVLDTPEGLKSHCGPAEVLEFQVTGEPSLEPDHFLGVVPEGTLSILEGSGTIRVVAEGALDLLPLLLERIRAGGVEVSDVALR